MNERERHARVKTIFDAASSVALAERSEILDEACIGHPSLREEVESLLLAVEKTGQFIERPIVNVSEMLGGQNHIDRQFGNYRLISEIGHGGMGAVFLAERDDGEFEQQVAIKLIRQMFADSELIRRFRDERQILARLQHPNIATLIDGGVSEEGQPFLAMEFVDGVSITEFCSLNELTLRERLKIFLKVCKAVAYAHRNLIVHRDIKPSNILVTKDGEPKLVDFGLAKLTDENRADQSNTIFRALTPAYASPEQIRGETITTASDIYSLGVVLYEVLTDRRPIETDGKSFDEIVRTMNGIEPTAASRLDGTRFRIDRDIDNILACCLRKEPERRYAAVEDLVRDIGNYLDGLPITARHSTLRYRAEKYLKRNKITVTAAVLILLSLFVGLGFSLQQTHIAQAESARSEKISKFMEKVLNYANPAWYAEGNRNNGEAKLIDVIDDLSGQIAAEFPDDLDIQAELHHKFAEIYQANRNHTKALFHAEKALDLRRRIYGENHAEIAMDLYYLSAAKYSVGHVIESVKLGDQAIAMFHEIAPENPNLPYVLENNANIYLHYYDDNDTAERYFSEALELFRRKDGNDHFNTARELMELSKVYALRGDRARSDEFYCEGEKRFAGLTDANLRRSFIIYQGKVLRARGEIEVFEQMFESSLAELERNGEGAGQLAIQVSGELGVHYRAMDNLERTLERLRFNLNVETGKPIPDLDDLGHHKAAIALCLLRLGREAEAVPYFEAAYQQFKSSTARENWLYAATIGQCLFYVNRRTEAAPLLKDALDNYTANVPPRKEHRELASLLDQIANSK